MNSRASCRTANRCFNWCFQISPLDGEKQKYNDQLGDNLAHASQFGKYVVASTGNHHIQLIEPDLVISSIRGTVAMAAKVRTSARRLLVRIVIG